LADALDEAEANGPGASAGSRAPRRAGFVEWKDGTHAALPA
jgi:hypothetical protein